MLRKVISVGTALAVALCVSAGSANAASIGVNLSAGSGAVGAGDAAGVIPTFNWNNLVTNSGTGIDDDSGAATSVDVDASWTQTGALAPTGGTAGDMALMSGGNRSTGGNGQDVQIRLQNLDSASLGTYDAYVYFASNGSSFYANGNVYASNNAADFGGAIPPASPLDTQTWNLPANTAFSGSWTEGTNYVKFTGLTEDTLVLTVQAIGGHPNNGDFRNSLVAGVQLVGTAPVPEPSTFALAGIGLVGLAGFGLRRRRKNA